MDAAGAREDVRMDQDTADFTHVRIERDRKTTRLNSSHLGISYAVFSYPISSVFPYTTLFRSHVVRFTLTDVCLDMWFSVSSLEIDADLKTIDIDDFVVAIWTPQARGKMLEWTRIPQTLRT